MMNESTPSGFLVTDDVVDGRRRPLGRWKVVSDQGTVIDAFHQEHGGQMLQGEESRTRSLLLDADEIIAFVPGGTSPEFSFESKEVDVEPHVCNGDHLLYPDGAVGSACGCPADWSCREAHERRNLGPRPRVRLPFRPAVKIDIGTCILSSYSWSLARSLHALRSALVSAESDVQVRLLIHREGFVTRSGIDVRVVRSEAALVSTQ